MDSWEKEYIMKVSLLGTDFHSGNRGCGALAYSAVEILKNVCEKRDETLELYAVLFAHEPVPKMPEGVSIQCIKIEPKKLSYWKHCLEIFNRCEMVLDFTGGDSFSDLYGFKRFLIASMLKEVAIKSKAKFIMAPQTVGPFKGAIARLWAKRILRKSDICFTRDTMSATYMEKTFGVNPLISTDVAFSLPYEKKEKSQNDKIKIGFNPSGLLWDGTKEFNANKHITVDYREYVKRVVSEWSKDSKYEVHLIPHVFTHDGAGLENDMRACQEIHKLFPETMVESGYDTPMEAKAVIATMDVFVGARMHATIAAFSSGVATIPFSYSRKFEGLYSDLDYHYLISATCMETEEAIEKTLAWVAEYTSLTAQVEESKKKLDEKQIIFFETLLHC